MKNIPGGHHLAYVGVVTVLLAIPAFTQDRFLLHVLIMTGFNASLAVSLRIIMSTGNLTLAHSAFMGIGAYASVVLATKMGLSFWLALPLSGLTSSVVAAALGYPLLKLKGLYFAITTFALVEILRLTVITFSGDFLGGPVGIRDIPYPSLAIPGLLRVQFGRLSEVPYYYLVLVLTAMVILVSQRLDNSRIGAAFKAVRSSDKLAATVGINVMGYRVLAFAIGSGMAGVMGSFYAHYTTYIEPGTMFSVMSSVMIIAWVIVGGSEHPVGPVLGAVFFTVMPEFIRGLREYQLIIYGIVVVLVMFYMPRGIVGLGQQLLGLLGKPARNQ